MQWDFTLRNVARPPPKLPLWVAAEEGDYILLHLLTEKGHVLRESLASFNDFRHPLSLIFH